MRQNGLGTLTLDEARTWIEETGLCLFLPRRQFSSAVAPSFVEAVAGRPEVTPDQKIVAIAEDLLIRLENEGVAVRLNLQGQPSEQPDFVVAAWVLPYVYALRGDRDWRRSPQLTGSRQVSQLAVHVYKQLESGDENVSRLKQALGREVSESAVVRAITELWQQLRIIPIIAARGQAAKWQLLRTRFQRAIAEGASTSQVTAISVLASIYLQAVIAASMEDVELFLAALTARSKIREVIRGLVATRQVHTISLGHAPHFYVAGTLPEFEPVSTMYASSSMPASAYFLRSFERDEEAHGPAISLQRPPQSMPVPQPPRPSARRPSRSGGKPCSAHSRASAFRQRIFPWFNQREFQRRASALQAHLSERARSQVTGIEQACRASFQRPPGTPKFRFTACFQPHEEQQCTVCAQHALGHRQERKSQRRACAGAQRQWNPFDRNSRARLKRQRYPSQRQADDILVEQPHGKRQDCEADREVHLGPQRIAPGTQEPSHARRSGTIRDEWQALL